MKCHCHKVSHKRFCNVNVCECVCVHVPVQTNHAAKCFFTSLTLVILFQFCILFFCGLYKGRLVHLLPAFVKDLKTITVEYYDPLKAFYTRLLHTTYTLSPHPFRCLSFIFFSQFVSFNLSYLQCLVRAELALQVGEV